MSDKCVALKETGTNPFVFVVGAPRSGTTLLKRMLDAHPEIAMTPETWWITRFYKRRIGVTAEGRVTPEIVPRLMEDRRFLRLGLDMDAVGRLVQRGAALSYPDFVSGVFDLYGRGVGKRLVGDKTPGYVRNLSLLHSLWPRANIVHIIRDGRDVWLSIRGWAKAQRTVGHYESWQEDPAATAALWWKWHVGLGREAGRTLPPERYREIRYEDLVRNPAEQCAEICSFLDVPYDASMLRYHEGRANVPSKHPWFPPTAGLRDWRSQMPGEEVERFEAVAGDLLDALGYMRSFRELSPPMKAYGDRMRRRFEARPLPSNW